MPQIVDIPGKGEASFPDSLSQEDIAQSIYKSFPDLRPVSESTEPVLGMPTASPQAAPPKPTSSFEDIWSSMPDDSKKQIQNNVLSSLGKETLEAGQVPAVTAPPGAARAMAVGALGATGAGSLVGTGVEDAATGTAESVLDTASSMTTPFGMAGLGAGAVAPALGMGLGAAFGLHSVVTRSPEFVRAVKEGDVEGAARAGTDIVTGGLMTLGGLKGMRESVRSLAPMTQAILDSNKALENLTGEIEKGPETTKTEQATPATTEGGSDAGSQQQTATLGSDVRPQSEPGVREVPQQESGAGVQPQAEGGLRQEGEQTGETPGSDERVIPPEEVGAGPGAATRGLPTSTGYDELDHLTKEIEAGIPEKATLDEKMQLLAQKAAKVMPQGKQFVNNQWKEKLAAVKAAGNAVWDSFTKLKPWTGFMKEVGAYTGAINKLEFTARKFANALVSRYPDPLTREAMVNWIQADGDDALLESRFNAHSASQNPIAKSRANGYNLARNLTEDQKFAAGRVMAYFDSMLQRGIDAGVLTQGVESYINQLWKDPNPASSKLLGDAITGKLTPNFKFARKRVFDSYFEGESLGYDPKIKDIAALVAIYDQAFNRAIAARDFIHGLSTETAQDGKPLVALSGQRDVVQDPNGGGAVLIKPDMPPGEKLTGIDNLGREKPYRPFDHYALKGWKWGANDESGKPVFYKSDFLIHPEAYDHVKNMLSRSWFRENPYANALMNVNQFLKESKLSIAVFHQFQEGLHSTFEQIKDPTSFAKRVNAFSPVEIDFNVKEQSDLIDHTLQLGGGKDYTKFADAMGGSGLWGKLIPPLAQYGEYLFKDYIPRIKMSMALEALARNRERYADQISSGEIDDHQLLYLTARQANAAFGELNYAAMGRNPTLQDFLRFTVLAPDFTEARVRLVGQAFTKFGREQQLTLGLMAATLYVGNRVLNQFTSGDPHWDPRDAFAWYVGGTRVTMRSVVGDAAHFMGEPVQFAVNRLSASSRVIIEGITHRDDRGIKRDSWDQLMDLASWLKPAPLQRMGGAPGFNLKESVGQSVGVGMQRATPLVEIYKKAEKFRKDNNLLSKQDIDLGNQVSEYAPLRNALHYGDMGAAKAAYKALLEPNKGGLKAKTEQQIAKYFRTLPNHPFTRTKASESDFVDSLSKKDQDLYDKARDEQEAISDAFSKMLDSLDK